MSVHLLRSRPYYRTYKGFQTQRRALQFKSSSDHRLKVRFVPHQKSTTRRVATFAIFCIPALFLASFTFGALAAVHDETQTLSEERDGEVKPLFIPLSWSKPRPQVYYDKTDPEEKLFKGIMEDREKEIKIKNTLVVLVRKAVAKDQFARRRLGKVHLYHGDFFVQLWSATGPPLEYERLGLEVDGLNVSFARRMVSRSDYKMEKRALWPDVALKAFFNSGKCLAVILAESWKARLERASNAEEMRSEEKSNIPKGNMPYPSPSSSQPLSTAKSPIVTKSPVSASTASRQSLPNNPTDVRIMNIVETIQIMRKVFFLTLMRQRKSYPGELPRGTCWAEGRIEIMGQKGLLVVYASGIFDMETEHYTKISVLGETYRPVAKTSKGEQSS